MSRRIRIVLADDLTGAAEIAAIAHEGGLEATIVTRLPSRPPATDLLVINTDTRLATPAQATRRLRFVTAQVCRWQHAGFFLKVDSVLRGPVIASVTATSSALGLRRSLIVPANPSLGRVIRNGRYFVGDAPISQTTFADDPHHPRLSDDVLGLLDNTTGVSVSSRPGAATAATLVAEAASAADIARWVDHLTPDTLPAGAADFFRAWLRKPAGNLQLPAPPPGPALLLHGTLAVNPGRESIVFRNTRAPFAAAIATALRTTPLVVVSSEGSTVNRQRAADLVARGFARLARRLYAQRTFRHLLLTGGSTAATVLSALKWDRLEVVAVWAPGVVSLRPSAAPGVIVTLKPGSYHWPEQLLASLSR